jgi:hypothetical protein
MEDLFFVPPRIRSPDKEEVARAALVVSEYMWCRPRSLFSEGALEKLVEDVVSLLDSDEAVSLLFSAARCKSVEVKVSEYVLESAEHRRSMALAIAVDYQASSFDTLFAYCDEQARSGYREFMTDPKLHDYSLSLRTRPDTSEHTFDMRRQEAGVGSPVVLDAHTAASIAEKLRLKFNLEYVEGTEGFLRDAASFIPYNLPKLAAWALLAADTSSLMKMARAAIVVHEIAGFARCHSNRHGTFHANALKATSLRVYSEVARRFLAKFFAECEDSPLYMCKFLVCDVYGEEEVAPARIETCIARLLPRTDITREQYSRKTGTQRKKMTTAHLVTGAAGGLQVQWLHACARGVSRAILDRGDVSLFLQLLELDKTDLREEEIGSFEACTSVRAAFNNMRGYAVPGAVHHRTEIDLMPNVMFDDNLPEHVPDTVFIPADEFPLATSPDMQDPVGDMWFDAPLDATSPMSPDHPWLMPDRPRVIGPFNPFSHEGQLVFDEFNRRQSLD